MRACLLPLLLLPAGCASKAASEQAVLVDTTPPGAYCTVERDGKLFQTIDSTPATFMADRDKHNMKITCQKPGYQTVATTDRSGLNPAAVGVAVGGGLIALAVTSAQGLDNDYTTNVQLTLPPVAK